MKRDESKKVIAWDLDEVLCKFVKHFFGDYFNPKHNSNYTEDDVFTCNLEEIVGIKRQEMVDEVSEFYKTDTINYLTVMPYALEALAAAKVNYRLQVITARPETAKDFTISYIERYFPGCFEAVHFTGEYHGGANMKDKLEVCKTINASAIVEDSYANALKCAESGMRAFLLKRRWNQVQVSKNGHPNLFPIDNLREIIKYL